MGDEFYKGHVYQMVSDVYYITLKGTEKYIVQNRNSNFEASIDYQVNK